MDADAFCPGANANVITDFANIESYNLSQQRAAGACKFARLVFQWARNFVAEHSPPNLAFGIFGQIRENRLSGILHCNIFPHNDLLWRTIKRLPPPYPPRMTLSCKFRLTGLQPASGPARFLLVFDHINKGGTAVDLTLRLNVLAVCAVFVFVGAILLGAF